MQHGRGAADAGAHRPEGGVTAAATLVTLGTATLGEAWPQVRLIGAPLRPLVPEMAMAGPALLELWQGFATVIAIDALAGGVSPGRWHVMDAHTELFPHRAAVDSSHGFGLAETIELARVLTLLPPALTVYGVEGAAFGFGEGLSPAVAKQVPALVVQICNNVRALAGGSS